MSAFTILRNKYIKDDFKALQRMGFTKDQAIEKLSMANGICARTVKAIISGKAIDIAIPKERAMIAPNSSKRYAVRKVLPTGIKSGNLTQKRGNQ